VNKPLIEANVRDLMKGAPSGYFIVVPEVQEDTPDDLSTYSTALLASWKLLLATAVLGAVVAAIIAFMLPPKFRAQALVAPVNSNGAPTGGGALKQLGGLAALAGIDIPGANGRKDEYLATLNSNGFLRDFIQSENMLPILFESRWDAQRKQWRAGEEPPTLGEAVKKLRDDVANVSDDRRTNLVTVTVDWYSPQLAARWANDMIEKVNEKLRADAARNAERSLDYLNKELATTSAVEIRQAIYRLIEEHVNNAMLASVQHEYAFRFIDQAIPPERKNSPKRAIMTAVGGAVGLFVGALLVRLQMARRRAHSRAIA
jgi:uncharacterized protein involved in exopolysaccharide biosynthesis